MFQDNNMFPDDFLEDNITENVIKEPDKKLEKVKEVNEVKKVKDVNFVNKDNLIISKIKVTKEGLILKTFDIKSSSIKEINKSIDNEQTNEWKTIERKKKKR